MEEQIKVVEEINVITKSDYMDVIMMKKRRKYFTLEITNIWDIQIPIM